MSQQVFYTDNIGSLYCQITGKRMSELMQMKVSAREFLVFLNPIFHSMCGIGGLNHHTPSRYFGIGVVGKSTVYQMCKVKKYK
jgi:hypothetical protein